MNIWLNTIVRLFTQLAFTLPHDGTRKKPSQVIHDDNKPTPKSRPFGKMGKYRKNYVTY